MQSKYLVRVLKILRRIYSTNIWCETNLHNLVEGTNFSLGLRSLMAECHADLKKMRVDLYVKGQVAIEVHGEQHEIPIKFSNQILDPEEELVRRKQLDEVKRMALAEAGVPLVTIWYMQLDKDMTDLDLEIALRSSISNAQQLVSTIPKQNKPKIEAPKFRTRSESFEARKERLDKARKVRKAAYRKAKLKRKSNVY